MNSSGGKTPSSASSSRPSAYNANAMAMIRNELSQYANSGEATGQQSPQPHQQQVISSNDLHKSHLNATARSSSIIKSHFVSFFLSIIQPNRQQMSIEM
jgi:hypothetical protein